MFAKNLLGLGALALGAMLVPTQASAQSCVGNCGTASPNGDVVAPPEFGPSYRYVSTNGGVSGGGQLGGAGGTNGSLYTTASFQAEAGSERNRRRTGSGEWEIREVDGVSAGQTNWQRSISDIAIAQGG